MQSIEWVGFGMATSLTRTVVHFFPSSGPIAAPYPVTCKLSIFGGGMPRRTLALEGARMSQPDGFRIDEVFADSVKQLPPLFGLELRLETNQPRLDLEQSIVIIELQAPGGSTRYYPRRSGANPTGRVVTVDSGIIAALVAVSTSDAMRTPALQLQTAEGPKPIQRLESERVFPQSAGEFSFPVEVLQGDVTPGVRAPRSGVVTRSPENLEELSYFVMYRDTVTKRPISVEAL